MLLPLLAALALTPPVGTRQRAIVVVGANQSFNWAGYVQGVLEKGTTFHSIAAEWNVPAVTQHRPGEAEYSSTWIGIGGGCVNADCSIPDPTLIQAGVGHDIDAAGNARYYTWWETIPAPSVDAGLAVGPGERVRVEITEGLPGVWTITIQNLTRTTSVELTLPYTSTTATAEWVLETPFVVDDSGHVSVGPLPDVSDVRFDLATTNGTNADLIRSEEMQLLDFYGSGIIALPSRPDKEADGFDICAYADKCKKPGPGFR